MYAIAALLVGGASVSKQPSVRPIEQRFSILVHSIASGRTESFGNAQIGEYFRVFVAYGVIGIFTCALCMETGKARKDILITMLISAKSQD